MIELLFVAVMCPGGAVVGSAAICDLGLIRCKIIHGLPYLLLGCHVTFHPYHYGVCLLCRPMQGL